MANMANPNITKNSYVTVRAKIAHEVNSGPGNFFTKMLSYRERSRITQAEVEAALERAAGHLKARDFSNYRNTLNELSNYRGACLAAAKKLLKVVSVKGRKEITYLNDPDRAIALIDALNHFPGKRTLELAKLIDRDVPGYDVKIRAQKLIDACPK